ncbi:MAG: LysR family transcriptional regulator [Pseudomonadota bacterium]
MRIKLRQIEGFLAAADTLSFSRAADRIGMTQPAFSQLVRELEEALGVRLFERTTRQVRITETGALLRDQMRRGLQEIDNACRDALAFNRVERGQLALAALPSLAVCLVADALAAYRRAYPGIQVWLHERHGPDAVAMVARHEVDVAVCAGEPTLPGLVFEHLFDDRLVAVLPQDHALAAQARLGWNQLAGEPMILLAAQAEVVRGAFVRNRIDKQFECEVLNSVTALAMARAGFGLTVVPQVALPDLNMQGLVWRPLHGPDPVRAIGLCHDESRPLSPAAELFRQQMRTTCAGRA